MLAGDRRHHARHACDASAILIEGHRTNEAQLADIYLEVLEHRACLAGSAPAEAVLASSRRKRKPCIPSKIAFFRWWRSRRRLGRAVVRSIRNATRNPWMFLQSVHLVVAWPVSVDARAVQ
jgi:hypothetical protein